MQIYIDRIATNKQQQKMFQKIKLKIDYANRYITVIIVFVVLLKVFDWNIWKSIVAGQA